MIDVVAHFDLSNADLNEFRDWAAKCLESVKTKDTGTIRYDWYLDETSGKCTVLETYKDSSAVLEHAGNLGDLMGPAVEKFGLSGIVYGEATAELKGALEGLDIQYFSALQSL